MATRDPKTKLSYKATLDSFENFLVEHNYSINQENAEDIVSSYINWFSMEAINHRTKKKGHSPVTVGNYYSRIKKFLRHLHITIDDIELPKIHEKELYPLKLDDIHKIFQRLSFHDQNLFAIQACSGLRIGEAVGLRKKNFIKYDDRYIIKIPTQIAKFHRARTTVVSKEMSQRVAVKLKRIEDDDLVFGTSANIHHSESNKEATLRRALTRIGLDMKYEDTGNYQINTHSFRAYFITHVSRIDPNLAKKMAGEKGYLLQYDRLSDNELVNNYDRFEAGLTIFDLLRRDATLNKQKSDMNKKLDNLTEELKIRDQQINDLQKNQEKIMRLLSEKQREETSEKYINQEQRKTCP